MTFMAPIEQRGALEDQARVARALGSPFVAEVLRAGQRQLGRAPRTARLIETWPRDASASALAMRFNAALHALARNGSSPRLSALYCRQHDDYDGAVGAVLAAEDDFVAEWMRSVPQTNEVGRAAAIFAALMVAQDRFGLPLELLEIGASGGLNLNLAHYAYELGGVAAGQPDSPVRIAPTWRGPSPVCAAFDVVAARGVDLAPLDPHDAATRERLLAHVWADQPARAARLDAALMLAQAHPPMVEQGDAAPWLARELATPQARGCCRVVIHSMVLQYLAATDRAAIDDIIADAGAIATAERPLARIGFEWTAARDEVQLVLTCWPSGIARLLATCHAYGDWISWAG